MLIEFKIPARSFRLIMYLLAFGIVYWHRFRKYFFKGDALFSIAKVRSDPFYSYASEAKVC